MKPEHLLTRSEADLAQDLNDWVDHLRYDAPPQPEAEQVLANLFQRLPQVDDQKLIEKLIYTAETVYDQYRGLNTDVASLKQLFSKPLSAQLAKRVLLIVVTSGQTAHFDLFTRALQHTNPAIRQAAQDVIARHHIRI